MGVVFGKYPQTCYLCRDPDGGAERRKAWGCDEPTPYDQARVRCYYCTEDTRDCPECEDTREVRIYRCPKVIADRDHREMVSWCLRSREGGPLPAAGGLGDQTAQYVTARDVVLAEATKIEIEELKRGQ